MKILIVSLLAAIFVSGWAYVFYILYNNFQILRLRRENPIGDWKVFKMNDCEWVAARTLDEAKQTLATMVMVDGVVNDAFEEEFCENPHALSEDDLDTNTYTDDLSDPKSQKRTFREQLSDLYRSNSLPCYFASTEY